MNKIKTQQNSCFFSITQIYIFAFFLTMNIFLMNFCELVWAVSNCNNFMNIYFSIWAGIVQHLLLNLHFCFLLIWIKSVVKHL